MDRRLARINRRVTEIAWLFSSVVRNLPREVIAEVDRVIDVDRRCVDEGELHELHLRLVGEALAIRLHKNGDVPRRPDTDN